MFHDGGVKAEGQDIFAGSVPALAGIQRGLARGQRGLARSERSGVILRCRRSWLSGGQGGRGRRKELRSGGAGSSGSNFSSPGDHLPASTT